MKVTGFICAAGLATTAACPVLRQLRETDADSFRDISSRDHIRALTPRPNEDSFVHGETAAEAFKGMNKVLESHAVTTAPCHTFSNHQLNDVARILHSLRTEELNHMYAAKGDKRAFHFDASSLEYKEKLWEVEVATNTTRDGKCAEMVMWYVHHLSERQRARLAEADDFELPLLPADVASVEERVALPDGGREYDLQITCTSCHVAVIVPGEEEGAMPLPNPNTTQYPITCEANAETGKAAVWYEPEGTPVGQRVKRCDWDYKPFCQPCEGIGGHIWGGGEDEWNPMQCTPVATPDKIPADNLTSPIWPKAFTVEEYASLTFPGTNPCDVDFRNSTYQLQFDTRTDPDDYYFGPLYHTVGHTGPSGPAPVPGSSWAVGNGNFYNSIDRNEDPKFCTCLGNKDPDRENVITGPLRYDFNDGALLIGREEIRLEWDAGVRGSIDRVTVADHWVKGPHHFWIEVSTNLMVREWQPFNGHQVYFDWDMSTPAKESIEVPELCYKGLLNVNISCIAGNPDGSF